MGFETILKYTLLIAAFFIFSILINVLFLRFSKNMGIRHLDTKLIRWSSTAKPAFGGIGFYLIFLLALSTYSILFQREYEVYNLQLAGIVGAVSLAFLMGLADDAYNSRPLLKFIVQICCALILIATGTSISYFHSDLLNYLLTILWVVGLMNSINMLDNMDAVAGLACFTAILSMLIACYFHPTSSSICFFLLLCVAVSIVGFLVFNWPPSKMYMGDTGSQFMGAFLAALSIILLWNHPSVTSSSSIVHLSLPILAFLVPLADTSTVFFNRLSKGRSPFIGGKDHTTHHLSYLGMKDAQIAGLITGIGFVSLIGVYLVLYPTVSSIYLTIFLLLYIAIVFGTLFTITRLKSPQKNTKI